MKRILITTIAVIVFLILGTTAAILYAKGYRVFSGDGARPIEGTGLLVLTSTPDAASVYINNHLTTATNNTLNLTPGEYEVKIQKDGYFAWQKKIKIQKEIVNRADATLFPIAPQLDAVTATGANNPVIDPSGTLIAYTVASASAEKNGVYVLNISSRPILNIGGSATQIVDDSTDNFSKAKLEFSPDGSQLIASISGSMGSTYYLLSTSGMNSAPQDITATLSQTKELWKKQEEDKLKKTIEAQNAKLAKIIKSDFKNIDFSPEQDKILYEASNSGTIPIIVNPRLIGTNQTPEERNIKQGNIYVYDIKEDRNYLIYDNSLNTNLSPKFTWYPDSSHLIFVKDKNIEIEEYDGQNPTDVYAGPFVDSFVFPWPDRSSLLIVTNFNTDKSPYNLYRLSLK